MKKEEVQLRKIRLIALALSLVMILSACGNSSGSTSDNKDTNNPSTPTADSNSEQKPDSKDSENSVTDDFLKTITAETAEFKGACGADLTWYYQDNVLVIKGTGEMTDYAKGGYEITDAPWGYDRDGKIYQQINWVIIDEGVTSIGDHAFRGCNRISKVELPSTLEEMGEYAFCGCKSLKNITFPDSLESIGHMVFDGTEIRDLVIPSSVKSMGSQFNGYYLDSITFLGDYPEGKVWMDVAENGTIYYSGSGFEEAIADYEEYRESITSQGYKPRTINWVKQ